MKIEIPIDAEIRRLAHADIQTCSLCNKIAAIVAREFNPNGKNIKNTFFCLNCWGDYLAQEFPDIVVKNM